MPRRSFTADEIAAAKRMRGANESWRAIGRALGCSDETIRRQIDPTFDGASRSARIWALQKDRERTERSTARKSDWYF